jgi:hypothetical protein
MSQDKNLEQHPAADAGQAAAASPQRNDSAAEKAAKPPEAGYGFPYTGGKGWFGQ